MRRGRLIIATLVALALALLLPPVQAVVRDSVLVPLLEVVWFANLIFSSMPQGLVWGFLVLVALVAMVSSGTLRSTFTPPAVRQWTTQAGLLAPWARLVFQSSRDEYARWRLAQRLAQLAQNVLGGSQPLSPVELRRYLANDHAAIPADVRSYLLAGLSTYTPLRRPLSGLTLFDLRDRGSGPLALDPERVVAFLEAQHEAES